MDALVWWWTALAVGSLAAGAAIVGVLVTPQRTEPLIALVGIAAAGLSVAAVATIAGVLGRPDAALYALAFLLGFGGGGYGLASASLMTPVHPPTPPRLAASFRDRTQLAIIVCTCVEPPTYRMRDTATMLAALNEEGLMEPSIGTLPLLFFAQKARYRLAGGSSRGASDLARIAERLQSSLKELDAVVTWASCGGTERLAVRVADALDAGHRRVVVLDLSVAPGLPYEHARDETERLLATVDDAQVSFVRGISDDDVVLRVLVERLVNAGAHEPTVGVVLVGQGQPRERSERDPAFRERETAFLSRLRMLLQERDVAPERVRIAWAEWEEPDVTSEVRHLAALGSRTVLVVPATRPVESLATLSDLRAAVRAAHLGDDITTTVMPAWGPEAGMIAALASTVRATAGERHARP